MLIIILNLIHVLLYTGCIVEIFLKANFSFLKTLIENFNKPNYTACLIMFKCFV